MTNNTCQHCHNEKCSQHGKPNQWFDGQRHVCDQFCDSELFARIKEALSKVGL